MRDDFHYIVGGATLGALVGALAGWLYTRSARGSRRGASGAQAAKRAASLDTGKLIRLGSSVIGVVRQLLELS